MKFNASSPFLSCFVVACCCAGPTVASAGTSPIQRIAGDRFSQADAGPTLQASSPKTARLYSITDLGDFPGGQDQSDATAINSFGQVVGVGQNSSRNRAFLASEVGGVITLQDLGELPRLPSTRATGINARGQIVGISGDGDKSRAFLWNPTAPNSSSGSMLEIENLPGERNNSSARGINASGQVAGSSGGRAFLWKPAVTNGASGTAIDLGDLPDGFDTSFAFGLNAFGQVVGFSAAAVDNHAFLWTPTSANGTAGSMIDLGNLPGSDGLSLALSINNAGAVVGYSNTPTGQRAFLWRPTATNATAGSMVDLGDLDGGNDQSFAYGINAANEVVGYSNSAASDHAFLWTEQNGIVDLNMLTDASGASWELRFAEAINDAGQIIGSGTFDPDGPGEIVPALHGFRLEPVATLNSGQLYPSNETPNETTLRFVGVRGVTYQLESTSSLGQSFQPSGEPLIGTGGIVTIRLPRAGDRAFWRVSEIL